MRNKKPYTETYTYIEHGKIPPQAIDVETAVLGQMLIDKEAVDVAISLLASEMFYKDAHQQIFKACLVLALKNEPVDVLTVTQQLRNTGEIDECGGAAYIAQTTQKTLTAANIESHCRIVQDKFIKRSLIQVSSDIMKQAYNEEDSLSFDSIENEFEKLYSIIIQSNAAVTAKQAMIKTLLEGRKRKESKLTGVPSGIVELDRVTLGWQPSDLIIIGARPSMGKTAFALQLAISAAELGYPTMFFSLEMSMEQLAVRLLTNQTGVHYSDIKLSKQEYYTKLDLACENSFAERLYIDDAAVQTAFSIKAKLKKFKKKGGQLAVIDYLQLMKGLDLLLGNTNRYIGEISRSLKQTAKELNMPIILLSQLSREVEKRANPFPILADLRDSGEIEQDADMVIFPTRFSRLKEKYHTDSSGNSLINKAVLDVAKHRNGEIGKIMINVSTDISKWHDNDNTGKFEFETNDEFVY